MSDENRSQEEQFNKYRMVIMNDETFEEISSFRVSRTRIAVAVMGILVGLTLMLWAFIYYTPIKGLLVGTNNVNIRQDAVDLAMQIDTLEKALADRDNYISNFRKVLTGDLETSEDIKNAAETAAKKAVAQAKKEEELPPSEKPKETPEEAEGTRNLGPSEEEIEMRKKRANESQFAVPYKPSNFEAAPASTALKNISQLYFTPPLKGYITADFQPGKSHYGVDVAAPKNTPIKSMMDGVVIISNWTLETGNIIGVQHKGNLVSFYKHNSVLLKKVGSFVKAGEAVAIIGNTGQLSDGPHLHFEIWHDGQPIDPTNYITF